MWEYNNITTMHVELSSLCNASCGNCKRFLKIGSRNIVPGLTQTYISFDKFKQFFPEDFCKNVRTWILCGSYGDPITNPDLLPILEYILSNNDTAGIRLNTNAGIRDTNFWNALGTLFSRQLNRTVIFSVDGLEDTNHLYRRNVKWKNVMNAMETYRSTGAIAEWDFLVFKHNEHQIDAVKELADQFGITKLHFKTPTGFVRRRPMRMLDKNGELEYIIEQSEKYKFDVY